MVIGEESSIRFYSSYNLLSWQRLDQFGFQPYEGNKSAPWETPSIITMKDECGKKHDILVVSENRNEPERGSYTQYFVGKFNGTRFNSYDTTRLSWFDNAMDNYAAIPYYNDPMKRYIYIGWMSNWLYAMDIPTTTWRGQMTIPREVSLKTVNGIVYLSQRPIKELNNIVDSSRIWSLPKPLKIKCQKIIDLTSQIPFKTRSMFLLKYAIDIKNTNSGEINFQFGNIMGEFLSFKFKIDDQSYELDRSKSGNVTFGPGFIEHVPQAYRTSTSNSISGQIILDTTSIEVFADDGITAMTALFFPTVRYETIKLIVTVGNSSGSIIIRKFKVKALKSIWGNGKCTKCQLIPTKGN